MPTCEPERCKTNVASENQQTAVRRNQQAHIQACASGRLESRASRRPHQTVLLRQGAAVAYGSARSLNAAEDQQICFRPSCQVRVKTVQVATRPDIGGVACLYDGLLRPTDTTASHQACPGPKQQKGVRQGRGACQRSELVPEQLVRLVHRV